jgi:hypothetical protein
MISELVKDTKQFYRTLAISLVTFVFILTIYIVLSVPLPLGSDPYFHLEIARLYANGNFTGAFNYIQSVNQIPFYPPFYHALLIPSTFLPNPLDGLRILEMFAMPLTFAFTAYLLWKHSGPKATFIAGLILLGSWSFIDAALQARPETIDLMFYPLMLLMLLAVKKKSFAALTIATVYNHGIMAVTNVWGWLPIMLKQKHRWLTTVLIIIAISSPILILTGLYFEGGWNMWATTAPQENPQEVLFWTNPSWIPFYAGITLIGFIFLATAIKHRIKTGAFKTELEAYLVYGFIGNLVMLPMWADRWLQYSTIPLACLAGLELARWHGKKLYGVLAVIGLGAWIYICFFLWNSILGNWWQPGAFLVPVIEK